MKPHLKELDFVIAAQLLGCEVEAIKAVCKVEAPRGGFLEDGRPVILFEAHIFSKLTTHQYDYSHPSISSPEWNRTLYLGGPREYERLALAKTLHKEAALKSASWGKFQILGINYKQCGYESVLTYVDDMYIGEKEHLMAFVRFCKMKNLDRALRENDWKDFARRYNGPKYEENKYDVKLKKYYESLKVLA